MITRRKIKRPAETGPKAESFDTTLRRLKLEAAAEAERVANLNGTSVHYDITLEQIDPRSLLTVMTEVAYHESAFTNGESLRQHWESSKIQRVSQHFHAFPAGYLKVLCPDHKIALIQFTSDRYQLMSDPTELAGQEDNMANTKHKSPPKKGGVKPVKPSSSAKPAAPKKDKPKVEGNYKWLLQRLKSQALNALSTDANRSTIREGLKTANKFTDVRSFTERAGIAADKFDGFLNEFFDASINR